MSSASRSLVAVVSLCVVAAIAPAAGAQGPAPGAPGTDEQYLPADKSGVGTSATRASRVWFTVQKEGGLGEVYFPTADAASARALQFVVGDRGRAVPANDAGRVRTTLVDARSLTYRTHAQYLRLAWDVQARAVLEQPRVVARRYAVVR
jgi:glucoamylase